MQKKHSEKEYNGRGVKAELGAFGASLWRKYLKFYRRNRIRGIGTVGLALIMPISMVFAFKRSRINYIEVVSSWFKGPEKAVSDGADVSSEEPESGFNIIVKFTYGTICSEPNFKKGAEYRHQGTEIRGAGDKRQLLPYRIPSEPLRLD